MTKFDRAFLGFCTVGLIINAVSVQLEDFW